MKELCERLSLLRKSNGVSLAEASNDLGIAEKELECLENGNFKVFKDVYELVNGSYEFEIYDLQAGEYNIAVTYLGDDNYNKTEKNKVLNRVLEEEIPDEIFVELEALMK